MRVESQRTEDGIDDGRPFYKNVSHHRGGCAVAAPQSPIDGRETNEIARTKWKPSKGTTRNTSTFHNHLPLPLVYSSIKRFFFRFNSSFWTPPPPPNTHYQYSPFNFLSRSLFKGLKIKYLHGWESTRVEGFFFLYLLYSKNDSYWRFLFSFFFLNSWQNLIFLSTYRVFL